MSSATFISIPLAIFVIFATTATDAFVVQSAASKQIKNATFLLRQSLDKVQNVSSGSTRIGLHLNAKDVGHQSTTTTANATTTRTEFLSSMGSMGIMSALAAFTLAPPTPVYAAYGDNSNMELPNYIEFLIEKNSSPDPSKILYKGADIEVQIKRISDAATRLNEIPKIASEKKWSQVQGILTGPLGTLVQTMNALCRDVESGSSKDSELAKKAAAKVKGDIILISQEASKKNEGGVVKACDMAQKDLEAFAKLVF